MLVVQKPPNFADRLISWYQEHKRSLPWRDSNDPYHVWLSEIILQQTQVKQGLNYYHKFITHYPTVFDLARASQDEVLKDWEGLGYYSRARNLHTTAKIIVEQYAGELPQTYAQLLTLKGIGEYTAAAIASLCFGEVVAVVDGNVFRVLARIYGLKTAINTPEGKHLFRQKANELISRSAPADYNQAIMEFGALHCKPKNPKCGSCIFQNSCYAYLNEKQFTLPHKLKAKPKQNRYFYYFIFRYEDRVLLNRRKKGDIWQGLYEFYLVELDTWQAPNLLAREFRQSQKQHIVPLKPHILTHQKLQITLIISNLEQVEHFETLRQDLDLTVYNWSELQNLAFPIPLAKFLKIKHLEQSLQTLI